MGRMSFLFFAKLLASIVTGMLGIPLGILPSVLLFRDLANGVDTSEQSKRAYAVTLWTGMAVGWLLTTIVAWFVIDFIFG
ncbi:MAG: hypothetical protein ACR2PF_11850 [Rhizobiaceae bacterium]